MRSALIGVGVLLMISSAAAYLTGRAGASYPYNLEIKFEDSAYVIYMQDEGRRKRPTETFELDHGYSTFFNFKNSAGHDLVVEAEVTDRASDNVCPITAFDCKDGIAQLGASGTITFFSNPALKEEDLNQSYTFLFRVGKHGGTPPTVIDPELQIDDPPFRQWHLWVAVLIGAILALLGGFKRR